MSTKILALIIYLFIRLLNSTYRYKFIYLSDKPVTPFIYAIWHQNLVAGIFSHIGKRFTMIVSESKDGELVATTCKLLGHLPARGSSTRGGKKALLQLIKYVKEGHPAAITVDGPKGPAHKVKPGVVEVARLTGAPIVSMSPYTNNFWVFKKSWDQFRIPKPFSKILIVVGKPRYIPKNISESDFNNALEEIAHNIKAGELEAIKILELSN